MVEEGCSYYEAVLGVVNTQILVINHIQWFTSISPSKVQSLI